MTDEQNTRLEPEPEGVWLVVDDQTRHPSVVAIPYRVTESRLITLHVPRKDVESAQLFARTLGADLGIGVTPILVMPDDWAIGYFDHNELPDV